MSTARPLIMGNWKMSLGLTEALGLAEELARRLAGVYAGPEVVVCPSSPHLVPVRDALADSTVEVGGQDLVAQEMGAVTGGVAAEQLKELGARYCILGHSERRGIFGESDAEVSEKLAAAFRAGLTPVVCVGESQEVRSAGGTERHVAGQVESALKGLRPEQVVALNFAYEPIWAIGTGQNASPEDAQAVHRLIRGLVREHGGPEAAAVRILYGGSVGPDNIRGYMAHEEIDGVLVGGASLNAERFVQILRYQDPA